MLYEYAYNHWCASVFQRVCNIVYYQLVTLLIICQLMQYLTIAQFVIVELAVSSETGNEPSAEILLCHLGCSILGKPYRAALHENDGLVTVLTHRCSRQSIHILCTGILQHLLKIGG